MKLNIKSKPNIMIFFCILFILSASTLRSQQLLKHDGREYYLNGINIPWHFYGADIGNHYQWGSLYDAGWFEKCFSDCETYGVNTVRFWLHCDGRASPEFDSKGYVTGLDSNFFANLDDFLEKAEMHKLMVIICLWSYGIFKDKTAEAGQFGGNHHKLVEDTAATNSYIENALIPIVSRYKDRCSVLAYEIMNEPEWAISENPKADVKIKVKLKDMQRFTGKLAAVIHKYSNHKVTMGSASIKWNSTYYTASNNYWNDKDLIAEANDSLAYLDFYQIHYYDWMYESHYDPFLTAPVFWKLDKPAIIGEFPSKDGEYSVKDMISNSLSNGWAGALAWSYNGNDGAGNFNNCKNEILWLKNYYLEICEIRFCDTLSTNIIYQPDDFTVYPNPATALLKIAVDSAVSSINYEIYDQTGNKVLAGNAINTGSYIYIDLSTLQYGIFFLKIDRKYNLKTQIFVKN